MSSETLAIECHGIAKRYGLGETLSLSNTVARILPWRSAATSDLTALDDVTFSVRRGAFFGIVGSNGSGKSTLTQIISNITVPTAGEARVWGMILPLLEVGAGFHDELTGRENVYLLGAILGLRRKLIADEIPRIVEFAGIERHLDTPMKRYSSGMRARLSFATAICFPADIYVFDEVLAVVDDEFREQCVGELRRLNEAGRTIIFMSHDLALVRSTCLEGMWLDKGRVRLVGDMEDVAQAYEASHRGAALAAGA